MLVNWCYVSQGMGARKFQTAKVTLKVVQGHWQWCHLIGHIQFLLDFHCNHVSIVHHFRDTVTYFQKVKQVT